MLPDFKDICILQYFYEKKRIYHFKRIFQEKILNLQKKNLLFIFFVKMWQPLSEASKTF